MPETTHPPRFVLDTNVWIDWLVFDDVAIAPLRAALVAGGIEIWYDGAGEAELREVLARRLGRRQLDEATQAQCLAHLHRAGRRHAGPAAGARAALPRCADPDDQKFLELACDCAADVLVTRDRALLALARRGARPLPFRIAPPGAALREVLP